MIHTKAVASLLNRKEHNLKKFKKILDDSVYFMERQGGGCNIDGVSSYYSSSQKRRDVIASLTDIPNKSLRQFYGIISEEKQKPIVRRVAHIYGVNIETDVEYSRFVEFLQELQNAHDECLVYEDFNAEFSLICDKMKEKLKC